MPLFDGDTVLLVWRARVACTACGPTLEALDWLEPHARVTNRLAEGVACLERTLNPARPGKVRLLMVDEFALPKGQNDATVFADAEKDALKALGGYKREGWARKAWENWLAMATSSGLPPLVRFAKHLSKRIEDILSHGRWHLNTSILEGINNKIKVLKRMAHGYRDEAYFLLKNRAAFPGNP